MCVKLFSPGRTYCLLHLIKQNYLHKNFSKKSNLVDSGISSPVLSSTTNLKLDNISITPKKGHNRGLDSSKVSSPDCVPVNFHTY